MDHQSQVLYLHRRAFDFFEQASDCAASDPARVKLELIAGAFWQQAREMNGGPVKDPNVTYVVEMPRRRCFFGGAHRPFSMRALPLGGRCVRPLP